MRIEQATVIERGVGAPNRPPVWRRFYQCADGSEWAVCERDYARARVGRDVRIAITSEDDQFANLHSEDC
jgi:hypothetical protein